jgi:hypothetical protein
MRTRIMSMSIVKRRIAIGVAGSLAIVLFTFIGGEAVKLLWNRLLPPLFGWPAVTFWQALGLLVLSRILFGGFGRHGGRGWRMKDEDRERIRQRVRERYGFEPPRRPADGGNLL